VRLKPIRATAESINIKNVFFMSQSLSVKSRPLNRTGPVLTGTERNKIQPIAAKWAQGSENTIPDPIRK